MPMLPDTHISSLGNLWSHPLIFSAHRPTHPLYDQSLRTPTKEGPV